MTTRRKNFKFLVLAFLILVNIISWTLVWDLQGSRLLEVVFLDVGQGDAIFIETPKRNQILIDGGPDAKILEKLAKEMPFYDRTIDLIILTHPEIDHMTGLIEVLKRYKADYIFWTGVARDTSEYKEWQKVLSEEKTQIKIAQAGQKIKLAEDIYLDVLLPLQNLEGKVMENSNDASIVVRLVFKENSFLFTGDISEKAEKDLTESNPQIKSDVLKVAHHGSKYSSSDYFLEKADPKIAVIEVGKNNYGHPTVEVLSRLEKIGIKIFRVDKDGDVKIISDGKNLKI